MIYGYARVSTDAQDLSNQFAQLKAAGCEKIFRDKLTGAHTERPQLQRLLRTVTQGDVVLVAAVDRLPRDTTDLRNTDQMSAAKARDDLWRNRRSPSLPAEVASLERPT